MKIKKILTALCAGAVFAAGIPCTASASSLSKDELREKYADLLNVSEGHMYDWLGWPIITDKNGVGDNGIDYGLEFAERRLMVWNDNLVQSDLSTQIYYIGDYKEYNNYYYVVKSDQTVKLIGADWDDLKALGTEKLELPSEIDGLPVNEADIHSFANVNTYVPTVKEIVIPDSITIIRAFAFSHPFGGSFEDVYKINFPSKVKYLGHGCFYGLNFALGEQVVLPETLEFIDYFAFGGTFTDIVFPESNYVCLMGDVWTAEVEGPPHYIDGHLILNSDIKHNYCSGGCITLDDTKYSKAAREKAEREKQEARDALYNSFYGGSTEKGEQEGETFAEKGPQTAAVLSVGDIDENGEVNVLDSVLLARLVVDDTELELSDAGKANADLNGDGVVTHDDLTLSLKTLAKQ